MIYFIMHFLTGYCLIQISGPMKERFLNLAAGKGILIFRLSREGDLYTFYVSRKGSKLLPDIAEKTGCRMTILLRAGLPWLFYRYRKRKCFAAAILISLLLFSFLSRYIWRIDITGTYTHSEEELLDYLKNKGIRCGMRVSSLSCPDLEEAIRKDFRDISWVSCERKGTLLTVSVKETLYMSDQTGQTAFPCNLIASKEGTIESIVVRKGTAKVKKGDKVKAGDILISGTVPLINDAGEITEEARVPADGDITAITKEKYESEFPLLQSEKKYTGRKSRSLGVIFFGYYYEIPFKSSTFTFCDRKTEEKSLHIGPGFYLPISLVVHTSSEYKVTEKKLSGNQAVRQMEEQIRYFIGQYEAKGVEILKNNVKIDCNELTCTARGTIIMRERFGKIQKI